MTARVNFAVEPGTAARILAAAGPGTHVECAERPDDIRVTNEHSSPSVVVITTALGLAGRIAPFDSTAFSNVLLIETDRLLGPEWLDAIISARPALRASHWVFACDLLPSSLLSAAVLEYCLRGREDVAEGKGLSLSGVTTTILTLARDRAFPRFRRPDGTVVVETPSVEAEARLWTAIRKLGIDWEGVLGDEAIRVLDRGRFVSLEGLVCNHWYFERAVTPSIVDHVFRSECRYFNEATLDDEETDSAAP